MLRPRRRLDFGGFMLGAVIVFAGSYYFLRNTLGLDLGELDWEPIWPILVVALGVSILYRSWLRTRRREGPQA